MKLLKHSRDKEGDFQERVLLHIPVGLLIGIPLLGYPLLRLFEKYELNEDLHTEDEAWKDFCGAMIGTTITILIVLAVVICLFWS